MPEPAITPRWFHWPPPWWPWQPPPPPIPPAPDPLPPADVTARLLSLHNALRAANGVGPLSLNGLLIQSATMESNDCARLRRLSHTSSDGRNPFDRMEAVGYRYGWAGENIAMGQADADAVCAAWASDAPHRQNMLNPHFRDVGFAMARDRAGTPYWTADFGSTAPGVAGPQGAGDGQVMMRYHGYAAFACRLRPR